MRKMTVLAAVLSFALLAGCGQGSPGADGPDPCGTSEDIRSAALLEAASPFGEDWQEKGTLAEYENGYISMRLTLPEGWQEHLSVKRDGLVGNAMGFRFVWSADFGTQEMFSVAAVSSENAAQVAVAEGWTVLEQKGEIVYVCRLESGAAAQAVSLDTVRTMFRLIRTSWRTGETH